MQARLTVTILLIVVAFTVINSCKPAAAKKRIHFEMVSDSLYIGDSNYASSYGAGKRIYEGCMQNALFQNALYIGLQENINIGSISNRNEANVNKKFGIFDTSNRKFLSNLFAMIKASNCPDNVGGNLKMQFYNELVNSLDSAAKYKYLVDDMDTSKMNFKILTLADNSLRPDSLAALLERTSDPSLLHFKQMLLTPDNALLVRSAMVIGFYCRFALKKKLTRDEVDQLKNETIFNIGNTGYTGSAHALPDQIVEVTINKYYTLLGEFYDFKEVE